jgi:hypothetical protein
MEALKQITFRNPMFTLSHSHKYYYKTNHFSEKKVTEKYHP